MEVRLYAPEDCSPPVPNSVPIMVTYRSSLVIMLQVRLSSRTTDHVKIRAISSLLIGRSLCKNCQKSFMADIPYLRLDMNKCFFQQHSERFHFIILYNVLNFNLSQAIEDTFEISPTFNYADVRLSIQLEALAIIRYSL